MGLLSDEQQVHSVLLFADDQARIIRERFPKSQRRHFLSFCAGIEVVNLVGLGRRHQDGIIAS